MGEISRNTYLEKRGWTYQYTKRRGMIVQIAWFHPDHGTQWQGQAMNLERWRSQMVRDHRNYAAGKPKTEGR